MYSISKNCFLILQVAFFIYLSVALYGVLHLKEGLERHKLARFDSYSIKFYDLEDAYFREYPYRINVSWG